MVTMANDLNFLLGGHMPGCRAMVDKRFDYHALQMVTGGAVELFYDDERWELPGLWMWPCYPGPRRIRFHAWPRHESWEHRYVAFNGPRVASWAADGLWPGEPAMFDEPNRALFSALFDETVSLSLQPGQWSRMRAANLLEQLLLQWRESAQIQNAPQRPSWLQQILDDLAVTAAAPDYEQLARGANMSLTTLRRRFRASTGSTLHNYWLECRAAEARRLLGDTDTAIKSIAHSLGYQDVYYFTRQFTQFTGVSPAAYRRSRQR